MSEKARNKKDGEDKNKNNQRMKEVERDADKKTPPRLDRTRQAATRASSETCLTAYRRLCRLA